MICLMALLRQKAKQLQISFSATKTFKKKTSILACDHHSTITPAVKIPTRVADGISLHKNWMAFSLMATESVMLLLDKLSVWVSMTPAHGHKVLPLKAKTMAVQTAVSFFSENCLELRMLEWMALPMLRLRCTTSTMSVWRTLSSTCRTTPQSHVLLDHAYALTLAARTPRARLQTAFSLTFMLRLTS